MMKRLTALVMAIVMGSAPVAFGQTAAVQANPNTGTVVTPASLILANDVSRDATLLTLRTDYSSSATQPLLRLENLDSGFLGNVLEVANDAGTELFWIESTGASFATNYMLSGDTNTGLRSGGADVLDIVTGNTTRISVGSSAVALGTNISLGFSGTGAGTTLTNLGFSAFGKTIIDDADAAAMRNTLGATAGVWPVSTGGTGVTALPKVIAYPSVNQTLTAGGSTDTVAFGTEVLDTAGAFASNTFTVPSGQGGEYLITLSSLYLDSGGSASGVNIHAAVDGTNVARLLQQPLTSGFAYGLHGSTMITANAGQAVTIKILQADGAAWQILGGISTLGRLTISRVP